MPTLRTSALLVLLASPLSGAGAGSGEGGALPPGLPFSEARRAGDLLFLSGQLGNRPGTRELVPGGIQAETRQALENVTAVLGRHGATLADVVKCTVMIDDIAEWEAMNEVYVTFFAEPRPARSALGADGLALGGRVEIECVAWVPVSGEAQEEEE